VGGEVNDKKVIGVFRSISAETSAGPFTAVVNKAMKLPDVKWIKEVNVYVYENKPKPVNTLSLRVTQTGTRQFDFTFSVPKNDIRALEKVFDNNEKKTLFIDFTFDSSIQTAQFKEYNVSKNWCYQIDLTKNKIPVKVAKSYTYSMPVYKHQWGKGLHKIETNPRKMADYASAYALQGWEDTMIPAGQGFEIQRHAKYGEVPDHKWYSTYHKEEYNFPWEKYEFINEDNKKTI